MLDFFKKTEKILAPCDGELIELKDIGDQVFSSKMLGEGFAITPKNDSIYSPVDGTIVNVFPTYHAVSILTSKKKELLIHIGIDTVELKGKGFNILVSEGDKIVAGELIASVDFQYLKDNNKKTDVIVVFPDNNKKIDTVIDRRCVKKGEELFII